MKEVFSNEQFKILNVKMAAGERMPWHQATSDAIVIPQKGEGMLDFGDHTETVSPDHITFINAHTPHQLEIRENFSSCILLAKEAEIRFTGK